MSETTPVKCSKCKTAVKSYIKDDYQVIVYQGHKFKRHISVESLPPLPICACNMKYFGITNAIEYGVNNRWFTFLHAGEIKNKPVELLCTTPMSNEPRELVNLIKELGFVNAAADRIIQAEQPTEHKPCSKCNHAIIPYFDGKDLVFKYKGFEYRRSNMDSSRIHLTKPNCACSITNAYAPNKVYFKLPDDLSWIFTKVESSSPTINIPGSEPTIVTLANVEPNTAQHANCVTCNQCNTSLIKRYDDYVIVINYEGEDYHFHHNYNHSRISALQFQKPLVICKCNASVRINPSGSKQIKVKASNTQTLYFSKSKCTVGMVNMFNDVQSKHPKHYSLPAASIRAIFDCMSSNMNSTKIMSVMTAIGITPRELLDDLYLAHLIGLGITQEEIDTCIDQVVYAQLVTGMIYDPQWALIGIPKYLRERPLIVEKFRYAVCTKLDNISLDKLIYKALFDEFMILMSYVEPQYAEGIVWRFINDIQKGRSDSYPNYSPKKMIIAISAFLID